uniref:Uncharacterized protein n=1 Tax=Strigamia maritima TaxID=126957 RepID=T1J550_STRMM
MKRRHTLLTVPSSMLIYRLHIRRCGILTASERNTERAQMRGWERHGRSMLPEENFILAHHHCTYMYAHMT